MRFQTAYNLLQGRPAGARQVRPSIATGLDLAKAFSVVGQELAAHQRVANGGPPLFSVEVEGAPQDLPPNLREEIYRIAGEALRNAFCHARARQVEVEIRYETRQLRVRVRDDGIGIGVDVLSCKDGAEHFGFRGMREHAKSIGGQLEVWSGYGAGTEVELTIPASIAYGTHGGQRLRLCPGKIGTNS